jgi:hypothetical protein
LFSRTLAAENLDEVLGAIEYIGRQKRKEGETALPDLGTILQEIKRVKAQKLGFSNPAMADVEFFGEEK